MGGFFEPMGGFPDRTPGAQGAGGPRKDSLASSPRRAEGIASPVRQVLTPTSFEPTGKVRGGTDPQCSFAHRRKNGGNTLVECM